MRFSLRMAGLAALSLGVGGVVLITPKPADAHGGRGGARGQVVVRGHYGGFYNPYYAWGVGFGYSPFFYGPYAYGPYAYGPYSPFGFAPEGGVDMNVAMMTGHGAIDLDVKPDRAEVWVDGKYVAEARDLDGDPSFLWLKQGEHRVEIRKGGYVSAEHDVEITPGNRMTLKLRMAKVVPQAPASEVETKAEP